MKQCAPLTAVIATTKQRLESIHISGLNRGVFLVEKIMLSGSYPRAVGIDAQYPNTTPLKSFRGDALSQNLTLGIGEAQRRLQCGALFRDRLISEPFVFFGIAALGEPMLNKPSDDGNDVADDRQSKRGVNWPSWVWWRGWHWYHWPVFFWMCFFSGAGMCAMWRLLTPND